VSLQGILAARDGHFDWLTFIVLTLGLFIAHGTNNILNDYTDFTRGVDKDNYFRAQYGVHPLVQKFWDTSTSIRWFIVSGILATLAGVFALFRTGFSVTTIYLFAFGAVVLLAYTYPFKYWGIGEFLIFLIWGPILIGRRVFCPFRHLGLECCPCGSSLWLERCQHQHCQTYR
jgi:1,4-dihydroxy-2-naphthoate octaprenyltransferase